MYLKAKVIRFNTWTPILIVPCTSLLYCCAFNYYFSEESQKGWWTMFSSPILQMKRKGKRRLTVSTPTRRTKAGFFCKNLVLLGTHGRLWTGLVLIAGTEGELAAVGSTWYFFFFPIHAWVSLEDCFPKSQRNMINSIIILKAYDLYFFSVRSTVC